MLHILNISASQRDRIGFTTADRGSLTPNKDLNTLIYRTLSNVIIYIIQKSKLFKMFFFQLHLSAAAMRNDICPTSTNKFDTLIDYGKIFEPSML